MTPLGLHFTLIAWENRKLRFWKMKCLYSGHICTRTPSPPQPLILYVFHLLAFLICVHFLISFVDPFHVFSVQQHETQS